jgi:hypothetical protein
MSERMTSALVENALEMAVDWRQLSSCSKISSYFGIIPPHHDIGGQK